jgi:hypothetical protein
VKATGLTADAFTAQWNIGRRTMFDLLDTQAEYITAKASLANAKYDKLYAEYRVLNSLGKLVNTLGLQWPEESRIDTAIPHVPRYIEPPPQKISVIATPPVARQVIEAPKLESAAVAPQTIEAPKLESVAVIPQTSEAPKPDEIKTVSADRPKVIKGIVLMNGKVIEGQILSMNVYTVKIQTKEGQEESYSFEKEVKGFIKE